MSDLDKLKLTFTEIGIKFDIEVVDENGSPLTVEYDGKATYDTVINIDNGVGYYGFDCDFYFLEGKSVGHGVWE